MSNAKTATEQYVDKAVGESVSGKADKAVPSASGNLASLDASGNLSDSGATPASIKAAAVAEVVANAPGTMDTLKEIADILGSAQQSGTVLKRISDLETGKVDKTPGKGLSENDYTDADKAKLAGLSPQAQSDWNQTDATAPDFIKNKPTLAAVATSGSYNDLSDKPTIPAPVDISGKQDALSPTQMDAVNSGATAAKVATWDGYAAQIAAKANAADVNAALQGKANAIDLSYALVTPGEWEFSDGLSHTLLGPNEDPDGWVYQDSVADYYSQFFDTEADALAALSLTFTDGILPVFTATRASLPGHLCDRAVNAVSVSADTTLTLPALVNAGKARDFLVRLEIGGSTVPTITFAAPTGKTITYETDGDEFPVPDAEGTWLYSFTETAAHTFAVALKSVSVVTQGGV